MNSSKNFIFLEIPEFEGLNWTSMFSKFKIKGIQSENPVIRLDNFLFQGRWVINKKSNQSFLSKKKKNNRQNQKIPRSKGNNLILKNLNDFYFSAPSEIFLRKKLRLSRVELCLKI